MPTCFFVSDLHGRVDRYEKLFAAVAAEKPVAVFIGGDLLPSPMAPPPELHGRDFLTGYLADKLRGIRSLPVRRPGQVSGTGQRPAWMGTRTFAILGNDDGRGDEKAIREMEEDGLLHYIHGRWERLGEFPVLGYSYVPPTPFLLKDWERYDVSRFVDPGAISPEEGIRQVHVSEEEARYSTISGDLHDLTQGVDLENAILLFHAPPHKTALDRAALDGKMVDHVPLDVHVGSIAIRRFIEQRAPLLTLHGHVHESARLTGRWREKIGRTHMLSAAHDGPELCLVRFDPSHLETATCDLV